MDVIISAKKLEIDNELRAEANRRAARLNEDYPAQKLTSVRVLVSADHGKGLAEIQMRAKNLDLHAAAKGDSVMQALGKAFDKVDTQLTRYLDRVRDQSVKADPEMKEKIWTSAELSDTAENDDVKDYEFGL